MWNLTNSDIIATASIAIALLALIATFWQAHIARKHNRLSVRPFVEHYQERIPGKHISISIANHGLGPARIDSIYFTTQSHPQKMSIDDYLDLIVLSMEIGKGEYECTTFDGETTFPPSKKAVLILLEFSPENDAGFKATNALLDETEIHLKYRCLYEKSFTYSAQLRVA